MAALAAVCWGLVASLRLGLAGHQVRIVIYVAFYYRCGVRLEHCVQGSLVCTRFKMERPAAHVP